MKHRITQLAKLASASKRGEDIDVQWLYNEALAILTSPELENERTLLRAVISAARALNDTGEYAFGGEIFELVLRSAKGRDTYKGQLEAFEGLAISWMYLGDRERAKRNVEFGVELAKQLNKTRAQKTFELLAQQLETGTTIFEPKKLKAPASGYKNVRKDRAHFSTIQKKS